MGTQSCDKQWPSGRCVCVCQYVEGAGLLKCQTSCSLSSSCATAEQLPTTPQSTTNSPCRRLTAGRLKLLPHQTSLRAPGLAAPHPGHIHTHSSRHAEERAAASTQQQQTHTSTHKGVFRGFRVPGVATAKLQRTKEEAGKAQHASSCPAANCLQPANRSLTPRTSNNKALLCALPA